MAVARRPFEIVAECETVGFPSGADIERLAARLEQARSGQPDVVRATVTPPAVYRDGRYLLDARFLVWAEDSAGATASVEDLLRTAEVTCRLVVPSGRALAESEVPRPRAVKAAGPAKTARPGAAKKKAARSAKPKGRAKPVPRAKAAAKRSKPARAKRAPAKTKRAAARAKRPVPRKRRSR
jgi:hypothetical protein